MIYLDHAAATPMAPSVRIAMEPFLADEFFNASAGYLAAKRVTKKIHSARKSIAAVIGARPGEIIFTAGGTEANNLAIQGVMQAFAGSNIVVSSIEHDSVLMPARRYAVKELGVSPQGVIDTTRILRSIDDETVLISVMYVNNEIGTIQPLADIARIVHHVRSERLSKGNKLPLYFHTDACQAGNYVHLLVNKLGVDLMTLNGGKLYGPKQSGALYIKAGTVLQPQILGGGQEFNLRSGTENPAGAVGFAEALVSAQQMRHDESKRLMELRREFVKLLLQKIPAVVINGTSNHIIPNNVHITIFGQDNERMMMALDERNIVCAVGSACSASNEEPSHVLKAIGLTDDDARSSLRFTLGRSTTEEDIEQTVHMLAKVIV